MSYGLLGQGQNCISYMIGLCIMALGPKHEAKLSIII